MRSEQAINKINENLEILVLEWFHPIKSKHKHVI